jgi:PAS domain S-box-containing protein
MIGFLSRLFDTLDFPARWQCGNWTAGHGWLHILSDLGVWSAYFAIPCILVYFVLRRRDVPFPTIFWLFGAFILACGTTHLMEVIIFWHPVYRLAGVTKLLTAIVSWGTVAALVPVIPRALAMRTPDDLEREIMARKTAEDTLQRVNAELESRVQERTAELAQANAFLRESQRREKERADELEAILRATPTPVWIAHDPQCHRITGNPASFTLLGLPEGANVSATSPDHDPGQRGFREYRGDTPIPPNELPVQRAARGEDVQGAEVKFVFADGRVRYIYGNAVPLRKPDGSVRGCVAAFADVTALKEAEESLRRNQQILKLVHQIARIGHWEWNSLTDENKWSSEIEALYGLEPGTFGGTYDAWAKLLHPDDLPKQEEVVRRAFETGQYFTEFRVIWPDGSVHWLEARGNVFKDGHDKPVRFMGVNMDVTERKQMEETLRQSETRFRQLADAMPQIVWTAQPDGYLDYYNERWYEYTGFPRGEYGQPSWEPILHPDDVRRCVDTYFGCIRAERPYQIEYRFKDRTTGGYRWFLGRAMPVRDEHGKVVHWFGTCTDIDDTKRVEEDLARQSERLREVAAASALIHSATTPEGVLQIATEEARRIIGTHQAVSSLTVNAQWAQAINARSLSEKYAPWRSYNAKPDGSGIYSLVCRRNQPLRLTQAELEAHPSFRRFGNEAGNHPPLRGWLAVPLVARDGRNLGLVQLSDKLDGSDFTAEDEAILVQLATIASVAIDNTKLYEGLRDADRRKDEFLAILAHELRNPLAPLRNGLQILRLAGNDRAAGEQARSMMERQLEHFVRLVDDLLDLSRISRGKIELRKERIELAAVVQSALETCDPLLKQFGHELTVTLPDQPVYVVADKTRLAQVVGNLLSNAAKYSERGSRIWLTAERQGGDAVLSVKDTGVGIPPPMLPRVFEMFMQVDRSLGKAQGGLGIGLSSTMPKTTRNRINRPTGIG